MNHERMRRIILYVVTEDWYFWSHRLALADAAKAGGYEVIVATQAGEYTERIRDRGFILIPQVIHRSVASPLDELRTAASLVRLYRGIKPDIIHHIALKPVVSGSLAAWLAGVPRVINTFTGLGYLFVSSSFLARVFSHVITPVLSLMLRDRKFHSIVQNPDDEKQLLALGLAKPGRTSLIPGSGVDIENFHVSPEPPGEVPVILFASRLLRDKGICEFIEAARLLKDGGVSARFVVAGNRDPSNPTSISEHELKGWIEQGIIDWWGYRTDMVEVFKQVHIVCLPSYREGLPKVLLEAAACGRPLVTTDVPGCRDVVVDGGNGYLVPVRDHVRLADALQRLAESPELRRQMGEAGRKRVEARFDLERINAATLTLYGELLEPIGNIQTRSSIN